MSTATKPDSFINVPEQLRVDVQKFYAILKQAVYDLRVAIPCVVVSFDSVRQTVKVQPTIREKINVNLVPTDLDLPQLVDVPILPFRAGGFAITLPIQPGDECLVVFGDMCINAWWQNGGTGNAQERKRRHDLSDGFAIFAPSSLPKALAAYSATALQIRSEDGNTVIELDGSGKISLTSATEIDITAPTVKINGTALVQIDGGHTSVDGKTFLTHKHSGVQAGGSNTGNVV